MADNQENPSRSTSTIDPRVYSRARFDVIDPRTDRNRGKRNCGGTRTSSATVVHNVERFRSRRRIFEAVRNQVQGNAAAAWRDPWNVELKSGL